MLTKKAVHMRGGADKRVTTFEEAIGTYDTSGWTEIQVSLTATVSTCMIGLGLIVGVQWKKNLMPTSTSYYTVTTKTSITVPHHH